MENSNLTGIAQIAGGSYLGYYGLKHGLPRMAGIRIEYHTTSKDNAKSIKKAGNVLDPAHGGKGGWAEKTNMTRVVKASEGYVHITGMHKDSSVIKMLPKPLQSIQTLTYTIHRKNQNIAYKTVGNTDIMNLLKLPSKEVSRKRITKTMLKAPIKNLFNNKTKKFCIPGIDSYFNENFIPDIDDIALKSDKPVKVYNSRFSAMIAGLKKFGLKGIKENKSRVAFGIGLVALGAYFGLNLITNGIKNIR